MHRKQVNNQQMKSTLGKDVQKLLKRIMQLSEKVEGELVHDIRVICKRVRAELLLLNSKSKRSRLKKISKEIGASLSNVRDAEVMLDTFDSLFSGAGNDAAIELRRCLESELSNQQIDSDRLVENIKRLKAVLKTCEFTISDWPECSTLLVVAKEKSRKKYQNLDASDHETYHDWRKVVKAYLYLLKLGHDVNHKELIQIKGLAEKLGLLHDLYVFEDLVSKQYPEFADLVQKPVHHRECKLLKNVHHLASPIYEIGGDVFQID